MGKWCLHASSFIFDRIIIKVAGNQDRHKSSDEFDFGPLVSMAHLYVFLNEIWPWHIGLRWAIVALWATCFFFLLKTSVSMFFSLNTHTNHSHAQPRSVARVSGWALNWLEESKLLSFMFMKPEGRSTGHYTCKTRIDCVDQLTVNHNDQDDR